MTLLETDAEDVLRQGMKTSGAEVPFLKTAIRVAGDLLAEKTCHDEACQIHASRARVHHEKATRAKGRNRR
jgi:hypothetical protein